jgi:NAD(P)-dependent dehydrogenase (short-subunit alcohol dehydrogenase family)
LVTGGTSQVGRAIAGELLRRGYHVALVGRDAARLQAAIERLGPAGQLPDRPVLPLIAELTSADEVSRLVGEVDAAWGRLDVLVNVVGQSDRGRIDALTPQRLQELITANVTTTLLCCQQCKPLLEASHGTVINIGSLAAKVGARYLGGYPAAKHALAGLTQQLRLEWKPLGIHVALVNPGPIRSEQAGSRYADQVSQQTDLPESAARPGGGTSVKGLEAATVARAVLRMIERRSADVMLPAHLRPLVAIGHLWPALGDWLLLQFTRAE